MKAGQLLEALRQADDPEAGMNIVDLGLVYDIEVKQNTKAPAQNTNAPVHWVATVRMTITSPACPLGDCLSNAVRDTLRARFPELEKISVELVWEPPWTPERMFVESRNFFGWIFGWK